MFVSRSSDRLSEALGSSDTQTKDPVRLAAYVAFCLILGAVLTGENTSAFASARSVS